jgi:hypothetical protein
MAMIVNVKNPLLAFLDVPNQRKSIASSGQISMQRPQRTQSASGIPEPVTAFGVNAYIRHSCTQSIHLMHFFLSIFTRKMLNLSVNANVAPKGHM